MILRYKWALPSIGNVQVVRGACSIEYFGSSLVDKMVAGRDLNRVHPDRKRLSVRHILQRDVLVVILSVAVCVKGRVGGNEIGGLG